MRPMRKVMRAVRRTGTSIVSAFDVRWWELTLECGHEVERRLRFPKQKGRQVRGFAIMHHPRCINDALPPPKRCRCEFCSEEGE